MSNLLSGAALLLALGSGLVTGVLWAFSAFVMRALGEVAQGAEAMQRINVVILRSSFMPLFMGLALISLGVIVLVLLRGHHPASPWLLTGSLLYLVGVLGVTVFSTCRSITDSSRQPPKRWTASGRTTCASGRSGIRSGRWQG